MQHKDSLWFKWCSFFCDGFPPERRGLFFQYISEVTQDLWELSTIDPRDDFLERGKNMYST